MHYANITLFLARKPAEPLGKSITGDQGTLLPEPGGI